MHTDYLKPNNFFGIENSCIYWAISELINDGITNIDAYNISNKLQSHPAVKKTIDKFNLPSVQEFLGLYKEAARNSLEEYKMLAENVITLAFKRDLIKTLNIVSKNCYDRGETLDKLSNSVYSELDKLTQKYLVSNEIHTLGDSIDEIWDKIISKRTDSGIYGIPSKYPSFDKYFTYEPGELVVVQGKYKEGKSILLLNEVVHKLKNGVPTLVVDSEMADEQYVIRLLSHVTGVDERKIKNGNYSEEDEKKIQEGKEWIKKQPFVHIYDPELTMERLYSICKILQKKIGLSFLVYDYFKSNETKVGDNYNILGAKCDYLKNNIAGKLGLPVLAACQLNREGEVADSIKINRYLSVGIKWGRKTHAMIAKDGLQCGNAFAKIYINRLGQQMQEDDDEDYIDFVFSGDTMTIIEAEQHARTEEY